MIIKWIKDCSLELYNSENDPPEIGVRRIGEIDDVEIVGYSVRFLCGRVIEDKNMATLQFGDGSITCGVNKELYEVIRNGDNPEHLSTSHVDKVEAKTGKSNGKGKNTNAVDVDRTCSL